MFHIYHVGGEFGLRKDSVSNPKKTGSCRFGAGRGGLGIHLPVVWFLGLYLGLAIAICRRDGAVVQPRDTWYDVDVTGTLQRRRILYKVFRIEFLLVAETGGDK